MGIDQPLEIVDIGIDKPHAGEVRVKLGASGVCHSDLSIQNGTLMSGLNEDRLVEMIRKHFKLTPKGIIESLDLRRPIYRETARHGHFGRENAAFTWEKTDKADALRRAIGMAA